MNISVKIEKIIAKFTDLKIFENKYSSQQLYQKYCSLVNHYGDFLLIKQHAKTLDTNPNVITKQQMIATYVHQLFDKMYDSETDTFDKHKAYQLAKTRDDTDTLIDMIKNIHHLHQNKTKFYYQEPLSYNEKIPKGCVIRLACDLNKYLLKVKHTLKKYHFDELFNIKEQIEKHHIVQASLAFNSFLFTNFSPSRNVCVFDKTFLQKNSQHITVDLGYDYSDTPILHQILNDKSSSDTNYMFIATKSKGECIISSKIYKNSNHSLEHLVDDLINQRLSDKLSNNSELPF